MSFIPAWKDKEGNRFLVLARNHVFETRDEAFDYQTANFMFYVPLGWIVAGIEEIDLEDGKGQVPHVLCDGPMRSALAVLSGPVFDAAGEAEEAPHG